MVDDLKALIDELESQTPERDSREVEEMEDLKRMVRPKLAVAVRELAEVAGKFRAHYDKHQARGK